MAVEALGRPAGGSTNAQGMTLVQHRAKEFHRRRREPVILATDGDFNVGVTSQGDLIRLIEQNRETGVSLSVLGFGMGNLKDSTMEKLADRGNGNYSYIDSLNEAQKVLIEEAGGTLVTVAKDVKLQIEFNPRAVAAYRLIGYENRLLQDRDFNDDKKDAGDMGAGHSVTALYEIVPAGQAVDLPGVDPLKYQQPAGLSASAGSDEAMTKLRYKEPDGTTSSPPRLSSATTPPRRRHWALPPPSRSSAWCCATASQGASSYADAEALAVRFKGDDAHGHRAEFIRLISAADSVSRLQQQSRLER
jgi:Ca-activated chloride channel family protein